MKEGDMLQLLNDIKRHQ